MRDDLQHWWAIFFTVLVVIGSVLGVLVAVGYHFSEWLIKRRSKHKMWEAIDKEINES